MENYLPEAIGSPRRQATIDETDPDNSLLRLFISDWKVDIICMSMVSVGSEDGWVGVGKRDGPGAVSGGG